MAVYSSPDLMVHLDVPNASPIGKGTRVRVGDLDITKYCRSVTIQTSVEGLNRVAFELVGVAVEANVGAIPEYVSRVAGVLNERPVDMPGSRVITFSTENL